MHPRLLAVLPLVLTSCVQPSTSEAGHTSLEDGGRTESTTFDGAVPSFNDAGTLATNSNDNPSVEGGTTHDGPTTTSPQEVSPDQHSSAQGDAGSDTNPANASTQGNTSTDEPDSATDPASSEAPPMQPGCGNGQLTGLEQCDDGNTDVNDGCSPSCRIERGFACESEPSVCAPTECGNGTREGVEDCDDGNTDAFDGCSASCATEPSCSGVACASSCGDGLIVNEDCDDGNLQTGDGCSDTCTIEPDFSCTEAPCEQQNGACILRVSAIHRDFADATPDFGIASNNLDCGGAAAVSFVESSLDDDGLPVFDAAANMACVASAASFSRWFREGTKKVDEMVLFDNGAGGFVNRFGANGEQFVAVVSGSAEQQVPNATSLETCTPGCEQRVRSGLQCDNECRSAADQVNATSNAISQLQAQLAVTTDGDQIAELESELAQLELELLDKTTAFESCNATCEQEFQSQVDACVSDCRPCSFNSSAWCTGGEYVHFDGTPLYFPVDDVTGPTAELAEAKLPPEYGYDAWPWEDAVFPDAASHNFSFTSEIRSWFRYSEASPIELHFMSDDDLFVFINGHLALDLGGAHTPLGGSVQLNSATAATFELQAGNIYEIAVFKAERQHQGSTLLLTLPPFAGGKSVCTPTN